MPSVIIQGWQPGFRTVSFIQLLQKFGKDKYSLSEAKALVDGLLLGKSFKVEFDFCEQAATFTKAANELGAIAKEEQ